MGGLAIARPAELLTIRRSLPHGHVVAVLKSFRPLDLACVLGRKANGARKLAVVPISAFVDDRASRLAAALAL